MRARLRSFVVDRLAADDLCRRPIVVRLRRMASILLLAMTVRLGARRQVRLPEGLARQLRLRKGAKLDVLRLGDGVYIVPAGRVPKSQWYFYTEEWQRKEYEADEALARGDVLGPFHDAKEAIAALRSAKG